MVTTNRKKSVSIKFKPQVRCNDVMLAGDFTDWEKGAIHMTKSARSGEWKASVKLTPGEHQYRFLVDGNWFTDPSTEHILNTFGGENSFIRVS